VFPQPDEGVAPHLCSITIELCSEVFGLSSDKAIYEDFGQRYRHFFPKLPERTQFVRQAAN
jgi:hypothetical protein